VAKSRPPSASGSSTVITGAASMFSVTLRDAFAPWAVIVQVPGGRYP
jgi:hypothetical protein